MHQNRLFHLLLIEALCAVRQHNNREFQSLGLVNRHQAHRAHAGIGLDRLKILPGFKHPAQQPVEAEQPSEALRLIRARPLEKAEQVFLPLCTVRQRAINRQRPGFVINLP